MKIAILGAGRMGSLIGGFATRGGVDCYLVDTWQDHVDAINANGLTIYNNEDEPFTVKCKAFTSADQIGEIMDMIVVLVMGAHTREAIEAAMCLADEHTYCITLQNGMGNVEVLEEYFPKEKILYGIVPYGGTVMGPGVVKTLTNKTAESHFASDAFEEPDDFMKEFAAAMSAYGLNFYADKKSHVDSEIWYKLAKNASSNAMCAICRVPLGVYTGAEGASAIENALFFEVAAVAAAKGITLAHYDLAKPISKESKMYYHFPSTAQDVRAKRVSEVDYINGAVARMGDQYGIPTPYNHMMAAIVKIIDHTYEDQF